MPSINLTLYAFISPLIVVFYQSKFLDSKINHLNINSCLDPLYGCGFRNTLIKIGLKENRHSFKKFTHS